MSSLERLYLLITLFICKGVDSFSTTPNDFQGLLTPTVETAGDLVASDTHNVHQGIRIGDIHQKLVDEIADLHYSASKRRHRLAAPQPADFGTHNLVEVVKFAAVCRHSVEIQAIVFNRHLVTACIAADRHWISVALFNDATQQWQQLPFGFAAHFAQRLALFVENDVLHILISDLGKEMGIDLVRIDRHFKLLSKEHTINSYFTSAVTVWKSENDKRWHLAVANSVDPKGNTTNLKSSTSIYTWDHTYFDLVDEVPTFFVKHLCSFAIFGLEYIAVINQKAGEHNFNVDSQILQFHADTKKWKQVQAIRTFAASDAEYFSLGSGEEREHFLVIANEFNVRDGKRNFQTDSIIYKFSVDKFLPFQCLRTIGATQLTTYNGDREKFVLLILTQSGVKMYQYNGWRFTESDLSLVPAMMGTKVTSLSTVNFGGNGLVLVSYSVKNFQENIFRLVFKYDNPLGKWYDKSLAWCDGMMRNHSVKDVALEQDLKHVFYINQQRAIEIDGPIEFNEFRSEQLRAPRIVDESLNFDYNHEIIKTLEEIEHELRQLQWMLDDANRELQSALRLNGDQRVISRIKIKNANLICSQPESCDVRHVNADVLNGKPNFGRGVLRTDLDQIIHTDFRMNTLHAKKDVFVRGFVDGINTSTIVTRTGNQFLRHPLFVDDVFTHSAAITGLVNGQHVRPDTVLLTVGDQVIESDITFAKPFEVENLRAKYVEQRPLQPLISGIVTPDGFNAIKGIKIFNSLRSVAINQLPMAKINGVDLRDHWDNLLWTHGRQKLHSSPIFTNVFVAGDVIVDGLVNKIRLPAPNIVTTRNNFVFTGQKVFLKPSFIQSAELSHSLNGLSFYNGHLNILLKTIPQTINSRKVFHVVRLGGKSKVGGNLQGIKLDKLLERTFWKNETNRFRGRKVILGDARFLNEVRVIGNVADINLKRLYDPERTMFLTEHYFPENIRPKFEWLRPPRVNPRLINGIDIARDLFTINTVQHIASPVRFQKIITVMKPVTIETFNDVRLSDMRNSLLMEGQQEFSENMIIDGNLIVRDIEITAMNDFPMTELVYLNRPNSVQEIYATKTFGNIIASKNVNVKQIEDVVVVNNVHFNDLIFNTLRYDEHQVVTGRKIFGSITVPTEHHVEIKRVNKIDLKQLERNAVFKNSPHVQEISGKVVFKRPVSAFDFSFASMFDGVAMSEMLNAWVHQGIPQEIHGNLIIANNVWLDGKLISRNGMNGFDLVKLSGSVVRVSRPSVVFGRSDFLQRANAFDDIRVFGRIGGVDFVRDTVKKNPKRPQVVFGSQFFNGHLVADIIFGKGWFNGISIPDLCMTSVRNHGNQRIHAPVVIVGNTKFSSLGVNNTVNNLNLLRVMNEMVFRNQQVDIRGRKHFETLVIEGPSATRGWLNEINWHILSKQYMSLTKDQTIRSRLEFASGLISLKHVFINGHLFTANGRINNISLIDLQQRSLKKFGTQTLRSHYKFENAVFRKNVDLSTDLINGINLNNDLMMKTRKNTVTVPKVIVGDVIVRKNLEILNGKMINDVDFSRLVSATVNRQRTQVITGRKHFSHLRTSDLFSRGLISGVKFSKQNIFVVNGNQSLKGATHFLHGFNVNGKLQVSGLVNGINIKDLNRLLVKKGHNNSFHNSISFNAPVRIQNGMVAKGHMNGLNFSEVAQHVEHPLNLGLIPIRIQSQKSKSKWLARNSDYLSQEVNYFSVTHEFDSERILEIAYKEVSSNFFYFVTNNARIDCESIVVKHFTTDRRVLFQPLNSFKPFKVVEFLHDGVLHFLVVNKRHFQMEHLISCLPPPFNTNPIGQGNALVQIYAFDQRSQHFRSVSNLLIDEIADVNLLSNIPSSTCFTLIGRRNQEVFISCLHNGVLSEPKLQGIEIPAVDRISILRSSMYPKTVVATYSSKSVHKEMFRVHLLDWSPLQQFSHIQTVTAVNPKLVHFVETKKEGPFSFLFIGEGKVSFLRNEPLLRVFRFNPGFKHPFIETQQFRVDFVAVDSLHMPDGRLLVFILTCDDFINVYQLKGTSGFKLVDTIFSNAAEIFTAKMTETGLNVALSNEEKAYLITASMKG